tara:strand:- start:1130 stop:1672 length:543 start_codon:yes stop_codon:yes gene_type:complete
MKFNNSDLLIYSGSSINVSLNKNDNIQIKYAPNNYVLENVDIYSKLILGKCDTCDSWYKDQFNGFSYDKVLVAGLGLGLIPQDLYTQENCSQVDVVDNNQEVIDWVNNSGHLDPNINLINDDIYSYNTSELYDLIIIDIYWIGSEMTDSQYESLKNKYLNNLNVGGVLYFPVNKKWEVKS